MNREEFCQILGEIDEAYVFQAHQIKKTRPHWPAVAAMAACLCLALYGGFLLHNRQEPEVAYDMEDTLATESLFVVEDAIQSFTDSKTAKSSLMVNWAESVSKADMDVAGFLDWPGAQNTTPEETFADHLGITVEEFTSRLPEEWALLSCGVLTVPDFDPETKEKTYRPHDFVLCYRNRDGGEVRIALCATEEPLRDVFFMTDLPLLSEIHGVAVEVYGVQTSFAAYFSDGKLFYDIETENVPLYDLQLLLEEILKPM